MKTKLTWLLTIVIVLLLVYCACRYWPQRKQLEDAIINLYIKLVCET